MKRLSSTLALIDVTLFAHAQFDAALAPFHHGVASGDALADKVIIWTHVTPTDSTVTYNVNWQIATDEAFINVANSGAFATDVSRDFTVKVDVSDLDADTEYFYRFELNGDYSLVGETRTMPDQMVDNLRFAVAACASFSGGYWFNAYDHLAQRDDIDAVIHLGDYIYESGGTSSGSGIDVLPNHEIISLQDYRQRYNSYRLDSNLREVHRKFPFYTVWDDHEIANDSWATGAQNHQEGTEGTWEDRLSYAQQAYFEWLPIRPKAPDSYSIYRKIPMGPLADLIMIDTRIEARDSAVDVSNPVIDDPNRSILGAEQKQWLKDQLSNSTAKWKVIGNQVMMAPLEMPSIPIVFPQGGILNADQWDGYRAERTELFEYLHSNNIDNTVVITGDIHTSWGNDLRHPNLNYDPNTGEGSVGVEFICTALTSGGFPITIGEQLITAANPHLKYIDFVEKGYLVLDLDQQRAKGHWVYVSTVSEGTYTTSTTDALVSIDGQNFLRPESALAVANQIPAPSTLSLSVYPNPTTNVLNLNIETQNASELTFILYDLLGKEVTRKNLGKQNRGTVAEQVNTASLPDGLYMIRVLDAQGNEASSLFIKE